ncbi:ABC transporter permease [Desulfobacter curvatus]|uniref:ABC transporter permease n=1 Tax=Desulfobacter curvatus TaxID=2290 RepID=UPI00036FDA1E|nr:ABC transporter permease [Desulfobacter curvatus]
MTFFKKSLSPARLMTFWVRNPVTGMAAGVLVILAVFTVAGPLFAPNNPFTPHPDMRLSPPSIHFPMGCDVLGRCLFSRILCGARASIGIGFAAVAISACLGTAIGLVAGFFKGFADELFMRITDMFLAFPEMVAAIALAGIMGPGNLNLIFAISCISWTKYARLSRSIALSAREALYVKSARLSGVSPVTIIFRHILPTVRPSMTVLATVGMAKGILSVSSLGFLGFGVQPPATEWGTLLMEGKDYLFTAPYLSIFPGLCIMAAVLSFNLLGNRFEHKT